MINFMNINFIWFVSLVGLLGLLVGSFLNVIIYRLPIMMELEDTGTFNLFTPRSSCPKCNHAIPFWHNIPVISYILLRGKCHYCKTHISIQYPLVELSSCILSIVIAYYFGVTYTTFAVLLLTWGLIALTVIDINHFILPDTLTLPLLCLGLLVSITGVFTTPISAIIGAITGYGILWLVAKTYKLIRHTDGMGYGDFKLLAVFGAWLGWHMLPFIILAASLLGTIVGFTLILAKRSSFNRPIPFGPFLALAGWIALLWGANIYSWYFALWLR